MLSHSRYCFAKEANSRFITFAVNTPSNALGTMYFDLMPSIVRTFAVAICLVDFVLENGGGQRAPPSISAKIVRRPVTKSQLISWPTEYPPGLLHQPIVHRNCFRESFHSLIGCDHLVCRYRVELTIRSSFYTVSMRVKEHCCGVIYFVPLENTYGCICETSLLHISTVDDRDFSWQIVRRLCERQLICFN